MKTIKTLMAVAFIIFSTNSFANKKHTKAKKHTTKGSSLIPVLAENPDEEAPGELKYLLANPTMVAIAPMVVGNADDPAPEELKKIPAYPVKALVVTPCTRKPG